MAARSKIDDDRKREIVERIMSGTTTVNEVARDEKLHPYQVQAWIGQMTLGEGIGRKYQIRPGGKVQDTRRVVSNQLAPSDSAIAQMILDDLVGKHVETDDPLRAIGEWYVRNVVLKKVMHKGAEK